MTIEKTEIKNQRLDRLEEALGVMNELFHYLLINKEARPDLVLKVKRIYLETPAYIKKMKESRKRIEKMIKEAK